VWRPEQGHQPVGAATIQILRLDRKTRPKPSPDLCVRGGREFGAQAVVVDAISSEAADLYRHFGFHDLDEIRLWRRIADIAGALKLQRHARLKGRDSLPGVDGVNPSQ
jgi:hypothetical protein